MFRVGMKVVCVDASPARYDCPYQLRLNSIYTIRGFDYESITRGLYLEEVPDAPIPYGYKTPRGWCQSRFRPIVERKTDISIFKAMLTPAREDSHV